MPTGWFFGVPDAIFAGLKPQRDSLPYFEKLFFAQKCFALQAGKKHVGECLSISHLAGFGLTPSGSKVTVPALNWPSLANPAVCRVRVRVSLYTCTRMHTRTTFTCSLVYELVYQIPVLCISYILWVYCILQVYYSFKHRHK